MECLTQLALLLTATFDSIYIEGGLTQPSPNSGAKRFRREVMIQGLHVRDAVGPLKNGENIIANDYDVAVAA